MFPGTPLGVPGGVSGALFGGGGKLSLCDGLLWGLLAPLLGALWGTLGGPLGVGSKLSLCDGLLLGPLGVLGAKVNSAVACLLFLFDLFLFIGDWRRRRTRVDGCDPIGFRQSRPKP